MLPGRSWQAAAVGAATCVSRRSVTSNPPSPALLAVLAGPHLLGSRSARADQPGDFFYCGGSYGDAGRAPLAPRARPRRFQLGSHWSAGCGAGAGALLYPTTGCSERSRSRAVYLPAPQLFLSCLWVPTCSASSARARAGGQSTETVIGLGLHSLVLLCSCGSPGAAQDPRCRGCEVAIAPMRYRYTVCCCARYRLAPGPLQAADALAGAVADRCPLTLCSGSGAGPRLRRWVHC